MVNCEMGNTWVKLKEGLFLVVIAIRHHWSLKIVGWIS